MTANHQAENIAQAVHLNIITEQEAKDLLIAIKQHDQKAIERLRDKHKEIQCQKNQQ